MHAPLSKISSTQISDGLQSSSADFASHFANLHQLISGVLVSDGSGLSLTADNGITKAVELMHARKSSGKKIMIIGNGGSASIASHHALDLWNACGTMAMTFNDASQLTCLANDCGYEHVFSKAIQHFAQNGDLLVAISSSGSSENILKAAYAARKRGCSIITYSGFRKDAPLRDLGDLNFYIDSNNYGLVEVAHQAIIHFMTDRLSQMC